MKHAFNMFLSFLLTVALIGCATTANYEKILASWVGSNVDELIATWGPPRNSADLSDGGKVLEYFSGGRTAIQEVVSGHWVATEKTCKTLFMVDASGVVRNWRWDGNACKAYNPD